LVDGEDESCAATAGCQDCGGSVAAAPEASHLALVLLVFGAATVRRRRA
jgi:MYXO-CTERM domain-containing protein